MVPAVTLVDAEEDLTVTKTPRGYEQSSRFAGETLFWRHVDTRWLIAQFSSHSCSFVRRDSSMLSEMYIYAPGRTIKNAIHGCNRLWARYVNVPQVAFHNVFIFRKNSD